MTNMVDCKRCTKQFDYVPGTNGGARQFCSECRAILDTKEMVELAERLVIEKNKYLVGASGRKNVYDPVEILVNGNLPEFNSDAERFVCAVEIGQFVNKTGLSGIESGIENLITNGFGINSVYTLMMVKQFDLYRTEQFAKCFIKITGHMLEIVKDLK